MELVLFGQHEPQAPPDLGFPIHYISHLHDDLSLGALYSAADVMVIPSRQDNLPNTALEAHSCGTPVVAFNVGGLPDIVEHKQTGYLANPFDTEDLAKGILWVLNNTHFATQKSQSRIKIASRAKAEGRFSHRFIAETYRKLYQRVLT